MSHTPLSRRSAATLATAVAFGLGAGAASPALAAAPTAKPVSLKASQYPVLVDNPGAGNDVILFSNVPGASWVLDGKTVTGEGGRSTTPAKVNAASKVTLTAVTGDTTTWTLPDGTPTEWTFPAPSRAKAPTVDPTSAVAIFNDNPGDKRDTVTLTNITGVKWTVTTGSTATNYDSTILGTKASVTVPITTASTVAAEIMDGYAFDTAKSLPNYTNTTTASPQVAFTDEILKASLAVGENPPDAQKGYGPGAAQETVKVTGLPGVKWQIGSLPAKAVTGVAFLPVDPDDIEGGKVTITAKLSGSGYTIPATWSTQLDFTDTKIAPVAVGDADVKADDKGGIAGDTLTLTARQGMTWWVGQPDATGKIKYAAQKAGKNGLVVYRVKHASRGTDDAKVYVKAVPNRAYTVNTSKLTKLSYDFTRATTTVPKTNHVETGNTVTLTPADGIVSWTIKYPSTVGTRTTTKSLTVKASDITATGATSEKITFTGAPTVQEKLLKDYTVAAS